VTLPEVACENCLRQQRFAGTYASPNEDVLCGFHTNELRKELDQFKERVEALAKELYDKDTAPNEYVATGKAIARRLREFLEGK
jgi:sugar-specific transcriptional regulator TrmB